MAELTTELSKDSQEAWTLKLVGHVNASTSHLMWFAESSVSLLKQLTEANVHSLIVDLSRAKSVDSHGLRLLIEAQKEFSAKNVSIILKKPNSHLSRLFRIMQFDRIFAIDPDIDL